MSSLAAILGGEPIFEEALPFARPTLPRFEEIEEDLRNIFESGMVTKGPYLYRFEQQLAEYLEVPHALGVANCTSGLYMLIKALGLTGEVIVPSFSFMASFHVIEQAGLTPVFVDCQLDTFTVDPEAVEAAITPRTSAIMAVTIFGNPPDCDALEALAKKHKLKLIFDSAHSFGTMYHGHPMGGHGDGEVFSTSATKLVATGEGGVVTTVHDNVDQFIRDYREYGNRGDYDCAIPGINGRLSELHAIIGIKTVARLDKLAAARNRLANLYQERLLGIPGISFQKIRENCRSSYKDFAILVDETQFGLTRDQLSDALEAENINTRRYFTPPGHRQIFYSHKYPHQASACLPNTDYLSGHILNLPIYSHMAEEVVEKICEAILRIYENREDIAKLEAAHV